MKTIELRKKEAEAKFLLKRKTGKVKGILIP